jgi:hypothetical protein
MDAATKEYVQVFQSWLEKSCRVLPALARSLAVEFVTTAGLTDLDQLQLIQQEDPQWLDAINCNLPILTKRLILSCVERIGRVPLYSLTVEDVALLVHTCFPEFPYNQNFKDNLISGFNLEYLNDLDTLKQFGIQHELHAAALMRSVSEWRRIGVPIKLLCLSDEEHNRRIATIKLEKGAARASPVGTVPSTAPSEPPHNPSSVHPAANHTSNAHARRDSDVTADDELSIVSAPCRPDSSLGQAHNPVVLDSPDAQPGGTGGDTDESVASCEADAEVGEAGEGIDDCALVVVALVVVGYLPAAKVAPTEETNGTVHHSEQHLTAANASAAQPVVDSRKVRALPTHALLSDDTLARFSTNSESASAAATNGAGSEGSLTGPVVDPDVPVIRDGTWEYRSGLSPQGKDQRLLVFVPRSPEPKGVTPGSTQQRTPGLDHAPVTTQSPADRDFVFDGQGMDIEESDGGNIAGSIETFNVAGNPEEVHNNRWEGGNPVWTSDEDEVSVKQKSDDSSFHPGSNLGDGDGSFTGWASASSSGSSSGSGSESETSDGSSFSGAYRKRRGPRRSFGSTSGGRRTRLSSQRKTAPDSAASASRQSRRRILENEALAGNHQKAAPDGGASAPQRARRRISDDDSANGASGAGAVAADSSGNKQQRGKKKRTRETVVSNGPQSEARQLRDRSQRKRNFRYEPSFEAPSRWKGELYTAQAALVQSTPPAKVARAARHSTPASALKPYTAAAAPVAVHRSRPASRGRHTDRSSTAVPAGLTGTLQKSFQALLKYCQVILQSRDETALLNAVNHVGLAAKKRKLFSTSSRVHVPDD